MLLAQRRWNVPALGESLMMIGKLQPDERVGRPDRFTGDEHQGVISAVAALTPNTKNARAVSRSRCSNADAMASIGGRERPV